MELLWRSGGANESLESTAEKASVRSIGPWEGGGAAGEEGATERPDGTAGTEGEPGVSVGTETSSNAEIDVGGEVGSVGMKSSRED